MVPSSISAFTPRDPEASQRSVVEIGERRKVGDPVREL